MAPLPPTANALKVQLGWSDDNDDGAMTVLHYQYSGGPPSSAQCVSMAAAFSAAQSTRFKALLNTDSGTFTCTVTDLTSSTSGQGSGGEFVAGTRAGDDLSAGTAALVNFQIGRRYRGGKPRAYLPLGVGGDIVGGRWSGSFVTAVFNAMTDFQSDALSLGVGCAITQPICVSYVSDGADRAVPLKETILGWTISPVVGSQRRRNRKQ